MKSNAIRDIVRDQVLSEIDDSQLEEALVDVICEMDFSSVIRYGIKDIVRDKIDDYISDFVAEALEEAVENYLEEAFS